MNQEKIGKFIATCRKDLNLTQEGLAEKLGITKNAVSKWERGLSFPDVSLYKRICKELNISIEELINGEKDNSDEAKEKAIITTIKEKYKIKKKAKMIITLLSIIFLVIIFTIFYYNQKIKVNLVSGYDYLYEEVVNHLREKEFMQNPDSKEEDFNVFYSYYAFGIEEKDDYKYVYMWIYDTSYYIEDTGALAISSGSSMPCKVTFKDDELYNIEYPEDGSYYVPSIKKMFPCIIAEQVLKFDKTENINKLFNEVSNKMYIYYDYLNLDMSNLTLDDISYDDLILVISVGNKECVPVELDIYKDKYVLRTAYAACKPMHTCTMELRYTKFIEGKYDYDVMQIIKHSVDANNLQFTNDSLPKYNIYSGKWHHFITDDDNKHLHDFLQSIGVDLNKCADLEYIK